MKKLSIIIMLILSFLLTSCENNNEDDTNKNLAKNGNINSENLNDEPISRERLSYQEYIDKYDIDETETNENQNTTENNLDTDNAQFEGTPLLENPENMLASYSTSLLSSSDERVNNLKIVCERLNNFILNPNETFSYNTVAGPYGPDDGFEEATILLSDGTKTEGYGGGVCQLSSTLYNVVKNIDNVEITERHHHSAPVAYVPEGEDATVSLQSGLDFKFTNNNDFPIRFEARCENWKVNVWAFKEV